MKYLKLTAYFVGLLLVGILIYTHTMLGLSPEWVWKGKFTDENRPTDFKINLENRDLYGVDSMAKGKIPLVMVHGSPGSWTGWEDYFKDLELRKHYRLLAVDRPGFGFSGLGKPELLIEKQASDIASVFERFDPGQKVVLMGHSHGGPVVVRMAIDFPERVAGVVILAGAVDPNLEKMMWIQHVAHSPWFSWLVPPFAYSTNEEILALKSSLETMEPLWKKITAPVVIIHGTADTLVPFENVDFMQQRLVNAKNVEVIKIEQGTHFIPWENFDVVAKALVGLTIEAK